MVTGTAACFSVNCAAESTSCGGYRQRVVAGVEDALPFSAKDSSSRMRLPPPDGEDPALLEMGKQGVVLGDVVLDLASP
jgi:hypothetical protein